MKTIFSLLAGSAVIALTFASASNAATFAGAADDSAYRISDLVANRPEFHALITEKRLVNGWGISTRPAGAGGHFWVTAKDVSLEYVGDVQNSPDPSLRTLHADKLRYVALPLGPRGEFATGTAYLDSKTNFIITQPVKNADAITAPAKFLFASDGGVISAWTERKKPDGGFDRPEAALSVIDASAERAQFFGITANAAYDRLYVADFGAHPGIRIYDGRFKRVNLTFDDPFRGQRQTGEEYAPYNLLAVKLPQGERLLVTYARMKPCTQEALARNVCTRGGSQPGEEDVSKPGYGRIAEFTLDGKLVRLWKDKGALSAPWGMALAPKGFGKASGMLLVGNFGSGHIAMFDPESGAFQDDLKDASGNALNIPKLWGLVFGNGQSLGDDHALYFAAGPNDEKDGRFGSVRWVMSPRR
jgi:uncharacterized protein (TIGR03118 family)